MIELNRFNLGEELPGMSMVTLEGDSGVGKGLCGRAVRDAADCMGLDARLFDNGLQWRIMGHHADGVDLDDPQAVGKYLERVDTRLVVAETLGRTATMSPAEIGQEFRTPEMSRAAAAMGRHPLSHKLARAVVHDQVKLAVSEGVDLFVLDGRATDLYGENMQRKRLVLHSVDIHMMADPATAAAWSLGDTRSTIEMSDTEVRAWAERAEAFDKRNKDDASRPVDPQLPVDTSFNSVDTARVILDDSRRIDEMNDEDIRAWATLVQQINNETKAAARRGDVQPPLLRPGVRYDVARGFPADRSERGQALGRIVKAGMMAINSGHTDSISEMTRPVVEVALHTVEFAKHFRSIHGYARDMIRAAIDAAAAAAV